MSSPLQLHGMGIRAQTDSKENLQEEALQSPLPQYHMSTESAEEARKISPLVTTLFLMKPVGLLIGFAGPEMYGYSLFPSQEEVWLDQAQAWQFMA